MGLHEDIMQREKLHRRFFARGFGTLHSTKILRNIVSHVMYVKEWESHLGGMKCL
jgi:hypothetical protein